MPFGVQILIGVEDIIYVYENVMLRIIDDKTISI